MPTSKQTEKKARPTKAAPKKSTAATAKLSLDVYGVTGKVVGSIKLSEEIFGLKQNKALVAQAVRVYLANQRLGTASVKTRGQVRGSTRKIYRQKGTGRARHGGVRAPIFVHGGIAHGPKARDFSLSMPQKMRKKALFVALSSKVKDGEVKVIEGLEKIEPKTKNMIQTLTAVSENVLPKRLLLVMPDFAENVTRAARNIKGVTFVSSMQLNAYDAIKHKNILFMKEAITTLEKGVGKSA